MARLSTAQHVWRDNDGFAYRDDDGQWKVVFHYTVRPLPQPGKALQMAQTFQYTPQFWMDVPNRELVQCIDTDLAGMALRNLGGGVETNADRVIQVEILGDEDTIRGFSDDDLDWIVEVFCKPLAAAHPLPKNFIPQVPTGWEYGNGASVNSPARLSGYEFDNYAGWMGHQNVPENEHTDGLLPGQMEYLMDKTYDGGQVPPEEDWFDMATEAELEAVVRRVVDDRLNTVVNEILGRGDGTLRHEVVESRVQLTATPVNPGEPRKKRVARDVLEVILDKVEEIQDTTET